MWYLETWDRRTDELTELWLLHCQAISKKWKITGLFVPFSGLFLIWNLGFLPRHSDGESPRVEPKSPSDHLEVSHGACCMMFLMLRLRDVLSLPWQGATTEAHGAWYSSHQFTYRWLSQGPCRVAWFGILVASRYDSILLLFHYISLHFTSVRPFSRFFLATGQTDFPGRKMKDPRLGASNWSHHIDIVQTCRTILQSNQSVNENTVFLTFTLFTLFTSFTFQDLTGQGELPLGNRFFFEFQDLNLAQHALSSVANHLLISWKFCKCFNWHTHYTKR